MYMGARKHSDIEKITETHHEMLTSVLERLLCIYMIEFINSFFFNLFTMYICMYVYMHTAKEQPWIP